MRVDVYVHFVESEPDQRLDQILRILQEIKTKEGIMSEQLDVLTVQVQETKDLEASAVALITGLAEQIEAIKDDPVKIQALTDQLKASAQNLSAAIIANTPAAPPPPEAVA